VFCTLFSFTMVLSHRIFLVRFLTRQTKHIECYTLFSFTRISHWVFLSKVLIRHILDGHPRGSVMNVISGCPYRSLTHIIDPIYVCIYIRSMYHCNITLILIMNNIDYYFSLIHLYYSYYLD
jgi:hypothetical protein